MTTSEQPADGASGSAAEPARSSLADAVADAVQSGADELARLEGLVAEAESRLRNAWQVLSTGRREESRDDDGFFALLDSVVGDLKDRLSESHRVSSTFNIVFFGRTGAGKSTLLSALGGLNGELVSDGRSDFTTSVRALDWHGCLLYDTPGINGWGRTRPRPDLEKSAREAVQVADVVLLCFDSQGPQASEFGKVAEWVRAYGKPAIGVFNMRNVKWRHPARESTAALRKGLSQTVQQHADTIASELDAIGLPGVPIVAINAKRGLFARASVPFVGPAAGELEHERAVYGLEYLDRWSNLPVLEQLMSACILEGAGDLKLAALREGFQVRLRELADEVDLVAEEQQQRGAVIERTVAAWLDNLGYPEPAAMGTDLLRQLEAARGEPFTAPVLGRLEGHGRHLLRSHLYPHRTKSLRAAETLILDAFGDERAVEGAEFEEQVFDTRALNKSIALVARQAGEFLSANLGLAGADARIELELIDRLAPSIRGHAGRGLRWGANVLRALGLLGSAASAALGVLALTNFWNPAGWVAAVVLVGTGAVSAILNFFGRRARKGAEQRRVTARARAVAEARATVNSYYDECETQQLVRILAKSWESATPRLDDLLKDALRTRVGYATVTSEARWLRSQADAQPPSPSSSDVIRLAAERVLAQASGGDPQNLNALLLGEDWILSTTQEKAADRFSELDREWHVSAADKNRSEFAAYLRQGHLPMDSERIGRWLKRASRVALLDQRARAELESAGILLDTPPNVVVLGDYSSGKTSLIKRLLADAGAETPTGLSVAAGRATNAVGHYPYGPLVLVDAPGFQSGQDDHDAVALNAAQDAAIVIVVLHVNLLIGETSRLERLLLGDEVRVGKAARTVYVIGRIDEVGTDPQSTAREFLGRRQRKVEELLSILESRGLVVEPSRVLPLSADPYALVGDRTPVVRADYAAANRIWDGISTLSEPLLALEGDLLVRHSAGAALDRGRSALLSARRRLVLDRADIQDALAASERLEQLMETSLAELRLLMHSIERRIGRAVDDHANEVLAEALGSGPADVAAMSKRLKTWWSDPRLESAIQALQGSVDRDLTDWWKRHASELDRELLRVEFAMNRDELPKPGNEVGDAVGAGMGVAAGIVRGAHGIGKALGNRDAVYAIGKALGAKFKPWGAVKLGAKVGKAAAVLGVVAVAFDIAEFVNDNIQQEKREQARKVAVEHVRATVDTVVSDLLTQVGGPIEYGKQSEKDIIDQLTQLREESELQHQSLLEISHGLEELILLQDAGAVLAEAHLERVMT